MKKFMIVLILFVSSCTHTELPYSEGEFSIYFCSETDCSDIFLNYLGNAHSASCAFYEIDDQRILNLFSKEGMHLLVDEDADVKAEYVREGNGIMHNKFCVVNDSVVLTGSFNPVSSRQEDYNTLMAIGSDHLAVYYQEIFDGIKDNHRSSSAKAVVHNGILFRVLACPQDKCQQSVIDQLAKAHHSIIFALFTFTDEEIARKLVEKHKDGLDVRGVVESWQSSAYAQHNFLMQNEVPVTLETSPRLQHNKFFVIDQNTLIMGSYNPTKAATTINDENILIITSMPVALLYEQYVAEMTQNFIYAT